MEGAQVVRLFADQEYGPPPGASPREAQDEVWDACEVVLGYGPKTVSEKKAWGKMIASLRGAGATAETIYFVAERYQKDWPDVDITLFAIEKWYSHFDRQRVKKARTRAATCPECKLGGGKHIEGCTKIKPPLHLLGSA